jgi:hypothetical protein
MIIIQLLLLASLLLLAAMPVVSLVLLFGRIRRRGPWRNVLIALSFVVGSIGAGAFAWYLVPTDWTLPFLTTLEASVNSAKYGHPIEHTAENILVFVTFACVAGGACCAGITAGGMKLWSRAAPMT